MDSNIATYIFAGASAALALAGFSRRQSRAAWWFGAICSAIAALCAHYDAFWAMVIFGLFALCCTVGGTNIVDKSWRLRFGLVSSVTILALLSLWPSASNLLTFLPCPQYIQERVDFRLVAGLDLRGGLRLVYTVDVDEAIKDRRDRHYEDMQLELAKIFELHSGDERPTDEVYTKLRELVDLQRSRNDARSLDLTIKDPSNAAKVDSRFLALFSTELTFAQTADQLGYSFHVRPAIETQVRESAVAQAKEIILRRVDELGLKEASVSSRDEDIIVEVPGQDESSFKEIRDIISQTARLEFKLLDDDNDFFGPMRLTADSTSLPTGISFRQETVPVGLDEDGEPARKASTYAYLEKGEEETSREALERFRSWTETLRVPTDRELGFEVVYETDPVTQRSAEVGWRTYLLKSRAEITGDLIREALAQPDSSPNSLGGWYVGIRFTDAGGTIFERITGANVKRRFAILLDGRVESAPVIQTRIAGGNASISMGGDPQTQLEDSRKLELVLKSGALPAPISPSNEQHIGPSLGRDSIRLGMRGALVGIVIILSFMLLYYRRAGLIANLAVSLNLFILLAVLSSLNASMTLPGIAGLALTVGMSVDSNVLINERIREELRGGKSARAAVELGYSKALSAIVDGQLTTLISAVVLAEFGTGPIKGFAVTLIVGVISSIFTGVVVTRLFFDLWVRGLDRNAKLDMG